MEDAAIYTSQVLNIFFGAGMVLIIKAKIKGGTVGEASGKGIYSMAVTLGGMVSGTLVYQGLVLALEWVGVPQSKGHGEPVIAAVLFNLAWAALLVFVGRVVLSWRTLQW